VLQQRLLLVVETKVVVDVGVGAAMVQGHDLEVAVGDPQKGQRNSNKLPRRLFWLVPLKHSVYETNLVDGEEIRANAFSLQLLEQAVSMQQQIVILIKRASVTSLRLW